MICFRDMTFCSAKCRTTACHRNWTPEQKAASEEWWPQDWGEPPVAFSDFSDTCPDYDPEEAV